VGTECPGIYKGFTSLLGRKREVPKEVGANNLALDRKHSRNLLILAKLSTGK
jgi:hypothetical protein